MANTKIPAELSHTPGISDNSSSTALTIDSSGNIGIGNSTPGTNHANANKLVVGNGTAGGIANYVGTGTGWYAFSRDNANNTDAYDGGISYNADRDLKFHTNAGSTRMTIDGAGNVGIATIDPQQLLHLSAASPNILLEGTSFPALKFSGTDYTTDAEIYYGIGASDLNINNYNSGPINFKTNNLNRVTIDSAGDVTVSKNVQLSGGQTIRSNTDTGTRFHTHLATCSGYSGTGCVVLNTNIPSYDVTGNTMFSIRIEGFAYDSAGGGLIDMQIGSYSGEGNWHNASYTAQNIPDQWIGRIRIGKDSNNKTVIIFGHTNTSINYEIAVTNFIQGFGGITQSYAEGWTFTKDVTSLAAYSNIAEVYPKEVNKIGFQCRTSGSTFTSGNWSVVSGTIASAVTDWNFGGYLNESTGKFLPKVPGWYTFRCGGWSSHNIASNNDRYAFSFAKNGSRLIIGGGNFSSADSPLSTHSQTMYLNGTTDYVNLELFQSQSGTWGTSSHNFWYQGFLENHGARGAYDLTIGN